MQDFSRANPAIERIAERAKGERVTKLHGYVGPADDEHMLRLYQDFSLTSYVEVPKDAVVHVYEVPNTQACMAVFVPESARIRTVTIEADEGTAREMLNGDIASSFQMALARKKKPKKPPKCPTILSAIIVASTFVCTDIFDCYPDPDPDGPT